MQKNSVLIMKNNKWIDVIDRRNGQFGRTGQTIF
jgi:hypothetical protein